MHKRACALFIISVFGFQFNEAKADYSGALAEISKFAEENCVAIKDSGDSYSEKMQGKIQAGVAGLFKKLANAGVSGDLEISQQKYSNVLQSDLASALQDVRACRERVVGRLLPLIDKLGSDRSEKITPYLRAGNDPTPKNPCSTDSGPEDLTLILGSNAFLSNKNDFVILRVIDRNLISVRKSEDGQLSLNLEVISTDGRLLARMTDNKFDININNLLSLERPNPSRLIVKSVDGKTYVDVNYLNSSAIRMAGQIFYKERSIIISDEGINLDSNILSNSCFGNAKAAIFLRG